VLFRSLPVYASAQQKIYGREYIYDSLRVDAIYGLTGHSVYIEGTPSFAFKPLGSWSTWVRSESQNTLRLIARNWTDSTYWYLKPDSNAMLLTDSIYIGTTPVPFSSIANFINRGNCDLIVYQVDFTAKDTVDIMHNLGTKQVFLESWSNYTTQILPDRADLVDANNIREIFSEKISGKSIVVGVR
jgi:hypothetical protein